jgi:signal transduction histidine kinase
MPISKDELQVVSFLEGGGEMGRLIQSKDWNRTSLGDISEWPQSLCTTLSIILRSKFPMFLFWGPKLICFYNDAFRPSLGNNGKHPAILGISGVEAWAEIWHIIKPLIDQVMNGEGGTWSEDQLIPIYRNGTIEDVYWTFSYSPVNDESNKICGVFVTCCETTSTVLAIKKIEESERKKDDFIKVAGHELKTPVTTVKGYIQFLLNKYAESNDAVMTGSLAVMDKQMTKLTKLINDLLDVTKIDAGSFYLNKEKISVHELIGEIAEDLRITSPTHTLVLDLQPGLFMHADKDRISQVLLNLLTNAIKYSPGANQIIIKTFQDGDNTVVAIQDFGIGIAPIDQEKVFERFYRVEHIDEKTFPGFGIGLFIVKEIITLHEGNIWVESEEGRGSSFYFSLPA